MKATLGVLVLTECARFSLGYARALAERVTSAEGTCRSKCIRSEPRCTTVDVDPVLADFDVRYGANAGEAVTDGNRDFLYAVITHGVATGPAAMTLAPRK